MKPIYVILVVGVFMLFLAMERVQEEKTGYRVASLMEDISFKSARNQYLRYSLGTYKSPDKITSAAQELGLSVTDPRNIVVIKVNGDDFKNKN
jgi:hypothetical protein